MNAIPTLAAAADAIAAGALSPVELVDACLARVAALEPKLDAFVTETADAARAAARIAEAEIRAGRRRGALHGIPIGLKDIIDTAGVRTTCHSALLKDRVPATDATVAARLSAAGAISLGKLSTHEFAFGGPSPELPWPPARNPWNRDHFTGGSSSGSDAALGALRDLGAETVPVRLRPLADWHACVMVIIVAEAWAVHEADLRRAPDLYGERVRDRVMLGAFLSAGDYIDAQRLRRVLAAEMDAAFARVDALVMPAAPGPAARIDAVAKWLAFETNSLAGPANIAGVPAQTACMGFTQDGLPLGVQFMGPAFAEARVLAIAHAYERATPWRARRPAP